MKLGNRYDLEEMPGGLGNDGYKIRKNIISWNIQILALGTKIRKCHV